jgi:sigma-E factor negative regulatory protein RseC
MINETTTVISVEQEGLWVEGIRQSACGSCAANAGCGHSLLTQVVGKPPLLKVLLRPGDRSGYHVGQQVEISIPEAVVVRGSLLLYLCPLICMIVFAWIVHLLAEREGMTVFSAFVGLAVGGLIVRGISRGLVKNSELQPTVIAALTPRAQPEQRAGERAIISN